MYDPRRHILFHYYIGKYTADRGRIIIEAINQPIYNFCTYIALHRNA